VFSDIVRDAQVLAKSREIASLLLARDPDLSQPEHADLADLKSWLQSRESATSLATSG
jgi:hypothetical protein